MIANYHTHTWRCRHADGTEREYVERAIEGGLKILGFSDHSPYPFPEGYDSGMRMRLDQVEGYVDTVLALKKEYDKDIEIHLGLETEYFPRFWDQLIDFLSDYPFEYFVLGQHSLGNEIEKILYSGHGTTDGSYLKQYVDQCLAGIDTGKYLYLAHPDLFLFNGDEAVFDREYRRLCREVKKRNIPLEINFLGLMEERWYPNEKFWKIAGEEGNTAVFGCDAHTPKAVWNPETEQKALQLAAKYGLKVQETVPMPKTFQQKQKKLFFSGESFENSAEKNSFFDMRFFMLFLCASAVPPLPAVSESSESKSSKRSLRQPARSGRK